MSIATRKLTAAFILSIVAVAAVVAGAEWLARCRAEHASAIAKVNKLAEEMSLNLRSAATMDDVVQYAPIEMSNELDALVAIPYQHRTGYQDRRLNILESRLQLYIKPDEVTALIKRKPTERISQELRDGEGQVADQMQRLIDQTKELSQHISTMYKDRQVTSDKQANAFLVAITSNFNKRVKVQTSVSKQIADANISLADQIESLRKLYDQSR